MSSVKTKIRAGTIFLFVLVVLSGAFSIYYLVKLKSSSENIIKANYESLEYAHKMQVALDSIVGGKTFYRDSLSAYLVKQEGNVTEPGEAEATALLRRSYERLQTGDTTAVRTLKSNLHSVLNLNMAAIKAKSLAAEGSVKEALTYLITIVSIILLVGLTFVYNFPSIITDPIYRLTEAISEISKKNYAHRIHMQSKDEFGKLAASFNEMAERLEYFESSNLNKLIFEKTRAEAVINSLKDASIGIDKNDTVLFANDQALQLLGVAAKDIVGMNAGDAARRNDLFRFLLEEKSTAPFKVIVDSRENYFVKETIDIAQDGSNNRVIVLKNITSFKELDVAKTNFIATVSHELKTPLAASDFSLKLLQDSRIGQLSSEQLELVESLKESNQRMLRILSELLNMAQVEAGKIQLNIQPVDLRQVVDLSVHAVSNAAKEKGLTIDTCIEQNLPLIDADADKLTWVLNNFLTNAIKYAPSQSIVSVEIKKIDMQLSVSVTDKGQGIDTVYLSRIFDRYFQVPGRSDKKGSGIGLAICKEFIEAMGGTVWVESQIGEGSTFGFDLPYNRSNSTATI